MLTRCLAIAAATAGALAIGSSAFAQSKPADNPTFGNRTEKQDGSVAMTIGRKLPTEWDTRFGMDANLAPEPGGAGISDTLSQGAPPSRSTGAVWGTMTGPGLAPVLWDKTSVDARFNAGDEQGKFAATMSRTLPLGNDVSLTLQDKYSVTQSLQGNAVTGRTAISPGASIWESDRSVRLNLAPTGTTLSAGVVTSNNDNQWHNRLSAEQQLLGGPLSVTTSVPDPSGPVSNKSIGARFKHTW